MLQPAHMQDEHNEHEHTANPLTYKTQVLWEYTIELFTEPRNSSPLSNCGGLTILPAPLLLHQGEDLPTLPLVIAAEAPRPRVSGKAFQDPWASANLGEQDILPVTSSGSLCVSSHLLWSTLAAPGPGHHHLDTVAQLL